MKPNILATKFHQPSPPPKRVQRPHLTQRLNDGLAAGSQLTLVSAPAGFGKSTCISEWVNGLDLPVAWLSLDQSDDDPVRFFTYFVAALQRIDASLGREIESVLHSGQLPPVEMITTTLINDILEVSGKFLLVLDDFQVIQERSILEVLERLISNQPEPLHLVLVTREDPLLPLARLRANNQMTEIRAGDLRFTSSEADRFLNGMMGLTLSERDITALENRTEGWIVGLQLAALALQGPLSMRGRSDPSNFIASLSGSHRYILSYLTEEVLSRQPEEIQNFLLQTSILDKLSGDLCDAVTGRTDSSTLLERLFSANLFLIPLDDEQHWYRYHHLFADLLRNQQSLIQKELVTRLHQRASQWYEQAGMPGEAIEHALTAADYPHAVELLESQALPMTLQGYVKTVEGWMQAIPPEWHSQSPRANLAFAWTHLLRGNYERVVPYLRQAEAAIARGDPAEEETIALQAESFALQSNLFHVQGKAAEGIALANLALQSAPAENTFVRGAAYLGLGGAYRQAGDYANSVEAYQKAIQASRAGGILVSEMLAVSALALMAIQHGQYRFAADVCSQAIDRSERSGFLPPPITGTAYGVLGIIYFEWNLIEKAGEYFLRTSQLSSLGGHTAGLIFSKVLMARLLEVGGDLEAAAKATQEAVELMQHGAPAWLKPEVISQQVRIYLAQGNPISAEALLKSYGISIQKGPQPVDGSLPNELLYLAHLRLMLYRAQERRQPEDLQGGIEFADLLIAKATGGQRMGIVLQAILLRALMQSVLGNTQASLDDVRKALELAEPEGYVRSFVELGEAMLELLMRIRPAVEDPVRSYVQRLLAAFGFVETNSLEPPFAGSPLHDPREVKTRERAAFQPVPPIDPLTERELEVLRLMAAGLKYEEISEQLVITLNTVRFHVKAIYSKFNVNNRTKAIETARQLGLL